MLVFLSSLVAFSCVTTPAQVFALQTAVGKDNDGAKTSCPLTNSTVAVYSLANGVGSASKIWVQDLLWWIRSANPGFEYMSLTGSQTQACDLASYPNLKLWFNPGGDAYDQLSDLGPTGTQNLKNWVQRSQSKAPSAYVGFCAGGYMAAHDYIWETLYEGPGYYNFEKDPPLSIFPHTVEGSLVDVCDDQFGDQAGIQYRVVNMSNGHHMLYYGGSTFGWNGVPDYADPTSPSYDAEVQPLVYYSDFYGYNSLNLPAAWTYRNMLLTSVHPEADNCTYSDDRDCPGAGTLSEDTILQNRAWLLSYINTVLAGTNFTIPAVPVQPIFDTARPHSSEPSQECLKGADSTLLFCDDFDVAAGVVPYGLSLNWQRNQTTYNEPAPWNVTYISTWFGVDYGQPQSGNGFAICVPDAPTSKVASIKSQTVSTGNGGAVLTFYYRGKTLSGGALKVDYSVNQGQTWQILQDDALYPSVDSWTYGKYNLPANANVQIRFSCNAGSASSNFCAVDTVVVASA